jgi:hypothetical protein
MHCMIVQLQSCRDAWRVANRTRTHQWSDVGPLDGLGCTGPWPTVSRVERDRDSARAERVTDHLATREQPQYKSNIPNMTRWSCS